MRYRCPDECAGVTHAGVPLTRAEDGTVEVEAEAAAALAPHGLVPVDEETDAKRRADDRRMLR